MLAIAYLVLMVLIGDAIARRWLPTLGGPHRLATAFLTGLLTCTWVTYLLANAAGASEQPLVVSSAVLLGMIGPLVVVDLRRELQRRGLDIRTLVQRDRGAWLFAIAIGIWVTWMMTTTLQFDDGQLRIGIHETGDFGPNLAIAQGFALGHNFPTQYPMFSGEPILYHFLYYFAAGNLTFLGLDPALANNALSIGSMVAMLVVLAALGERLFRSVAVGRVAVILFFFHGSLSFVPYLASFTSPAEALDTIPRLSNYLSSGFPYRGEDWAIWTQNVFLNQRHLASAVGVLLVAVLFVVDRIQPEQGAARRDRAIAGYVMCGVLLGLLPLWNGAIYVASAVILGGVLVFFSGRAQLVALALAAAVVSVPQILFLRPEGTQPVPYPALHLGYVVDPATPWHVAAYVGFLFGPKLLLAAVALLSGTSVQRRFFAALTVLVVMAFVVQLTIDISQNHKFLTTWLIVANTYVAYGLVRLWRGTLAWRSRSVGRPLQRVVAVVLALVIAIGGGIDLIPIANDGLQVQRVTGDRLFEWVRDQTDRRAVFLTDIVIHHPILLAGRRIYLGWPAYPFSMGYDMATREASYRRLLSSTSPRDVLRELQAAGIDYVAFDDGVRSEHYVQDINEDLFREHFETVYTDPDNDHQNVAIYRVPTDRDAWRSLPGADPVNVFTGGHGTDAGRFDGPRGVGLAPDGTIFVADTRNHRVQKFTADGAFLIEFGGPGTGAGQFSEPHGVAADSLGHVWVADSLNHRVQGFDPVGRFVQEWTGPEPGFYGPRDVSVGRDDTLYVLDQGRARVVRRTPDGSADAFGSFGAGDGQLNDPTGLGTGGEVVAVADPRNGRIAVFDDTGTFVRNIEVEEWVGAPGSPDVAVSADGRSIVATSPATDQVLGFSIDGARTVTVGSSEAARLEEPGAIAFVPDGGVLVANLRSNRLSRLER